MFDEQLSNLATSPPRSLRLLPGLLVWNAIFHREVWIPLLYIGLFGLLPVLMLFAELRSKLSFGPSQIAAGTVIQATAVQHTRDTEITYRFRTTDDQEYRATRTVGSESPYTGVHPGDSVPIRYQIGRPSRSLIVEDREKDADHLFFFLLFPLFAAVFFLGPTSIPRLIQLLKDRRVFRKGELTDASVVFVNPRGVFSWFGWCGLYSADVFVKFQLSSGDQAEAKTVCRNDWLLRQLGPGTSVHIAYMPNRPARVVLLETYVR